MHRLSEKQRTFTLIMMRMLEKAWVDSPYNANIDRQYGITIPPIMADLVTWTDWSKMLSEVIPILEHQDAPPLTETPDERARDLQLIYERLNLTPPTE